MPIEISSKGSPILSFDDWARLAAPRGKDRHWVAGRSALECAAAWTRPLLDVPADIRRLLDSHPDVARAVIGRVFPELPIPFDALGEPRNADVAAEASDDRGRVAITIEAKADESFDRRVRSVRASAQAKVDEEIPTNAITRIDGLIPALFRDTDPEVIGQLRYQLLTAVAGTLAYAAQLNASRAVFIVHEFLSDSTTAENRERNRGDLERFVVHLGGDAAPLANERLTGPILVPGGLKFPEPAALYIGKVSTQL